MQSSLANDDRVHSEHKMELEISEYSFDGCKGIFFEEKCVIKHTIKTEKHIFVSIVKNGKRTTQGYLIRTGYWHFNIDIYDWTYNRDGNPNM